MKAGDIVKVLKINKKGVIQSIKDNGSVCVLVGSMNLKCKINEIEYLSGPRPGQVDSLNIVKNPRKGNPKKLLSIDLHGLTAQEAEIKLEDHLNSAVLAEIERLEVIHGIGHGILKRTVEKVLSSIKVVKSYRIDPSNPGVTIVYL